MLYFIMRHKLASITLLFFFVLIQCHAQIDSAAVNDSTLYPYLLIDEKGFHPHELINYKRQLEMDKELDIAFYKERKRFCYTACDAYSQGFIYRSLNLPVDTKLLRQLLLCSENDTIEEEAYNLILEPCNNIKNAENDNHIRVFTLDEAQKDSSILFVRTDGDNDPRRTGYLGGFLVFRKDKTQYHLTDVGFGELVGFDVLKSGRLQPLIWVFPKNASNAIQNAEIRLEWDGEHLKANEVTLLQQVNPLGFYINFSTNDIKKHKKYKRLRKLCINEEHEIQKGVKIHWKHNSFSLSNRMLKNVDYRDFWNDKGFKID
jgi:hypothetical protein